MLHILLKQSNRWDHIICYLHHLHYQC